MKILYLSTPYFADCDFPLVRTFQEKGVDVTYLLLLSPHSLSTTLIDIKQQLPQTKIFPASVYAELKQYENYFDLNNMYLANNTGRSRLTFSYWKNIQNIRRFIRQGRFDVIHDSSRYDWIYGLAPVITTFHDPFPHSGEDYKRQKSVYQQTIKRSKGVVLLNNNQLDTFCQYYSISPKKVLINCLGIYDNIRSFVSPNVKHVKNNILFFGRISPYKGIEYLCEAMKLVHEQIPDATLTIAGNGKFYFDINQYVRFGYFNIYNRYITMSELAELLTKCELCVCPYTDATQSGVLMTCFSLGKPVIASAVGGLCEMIEEGKSGVLVPPRDVKALAEAIIAILNNSNLKRHMSEYIYNEYIIGEKSWSAIADRYLKYYEDITNNCI